MAAFMLHVRNKRIYIFIFVVWLYQKGISPRISLQLVGKTVGKLGKLQEVRYYWIPDRIIPNNFVFFVHINYSGIRHIYTYITYIFYIVLKGQKRASQPNTLHVSSLNLIRLRYKIKSEKFSRTSSTLLHI